MSREQKEKKYCALIEHPKHWLFRNEYCVKQKYGAASTTLTQLQIPKRRIEAFYYVRLLMKFFSPPLMEVTADLSAFVATVEAAGEASSTLTAY